MSHTGHMSAQCRSCQISDFFRYVFFKSQESQQNQHAFLKLRYVALRNVIFLTVSIRFSNLIESKDILFQCQGSLY